MAPQTEQLLAECEQQQKDNKTQLDETAQRWETAARAGCASVDELETQLDKLKTISKRLALRKAALTEQLAADAEASRLASIEQLQAVIAATTSELTKQYTAIRLARDKFGAQLAATLEGGQVLKQQLAKLAQLGGGEGVPECIVQFSTDNQVDTNEFQRQHGYILALPAQVYDYAQSQSAHATRVRKMNEGK